MSEYGGATVTSMAAPTSLVVLLVAGVSRAALQAARVAGHAVLDAPDMAERAIAPLVRAVTDRLALAADALAAEAPSTHLPMFDTPQMLDGIMQQVTQSMAGGASLTIQRAEALARVFEVNDGLRLVAEAMAPGHLADVLGARVAMAEAVRAGQNERADALAANVLSELEHVVEGAAGRLCQARRVTAAGIVGVAMEDHGFSVRVGTSRDGIAVVGSRGDQRAAMVVGAAGRVDFDMEGFEGAACHADLQALLASVRRRGLQMGHVEVLHHGCLAGGPVIDAARRSGDSLEVALANLAATLPGLPVRRSTQLAATAGAHGSPTSRTHVGGKTR